VILLHEVVENKFSRNYTRELVMAFGYVFIVLVIIAVIYAYISASQEVEYVKSSLDGKDYLVQKMDNSQDAANVIASVTMTWCLL
jgi:Na+-transporting methylmalonyl-CoA/oxaloacetate decarboxylase gamma subunit